MATQHCSRSGTVYPHFSSRPTAALAAVLDNLSDAPLLARLWLYRVNGRPGWPLRSLWRAYVASFVLNLGSTNDLIRLLMRDRQVRRLCGFGARLPHRTTFNRFVSRLACHPDLVEQSFASVTGKLKELLPDLGNEVAVDSTVVCTHANPNRQILSDPQASWTAKNSTKAKEGGKEWHYGYKLHMVADANHGIPLGMVVTTAKRGDSPELPSVMDRARGWFPWFRPTAVMADRGYDGMSNYRHIQRHGAVPVILIRELSRTKLYDGIYTKEGVPTCLGQIPMEYVRTDPATGHHLYRCAGCDLAGTTAGMVLRCDDEVWEDPAQNPRLFSPIRRQSPEWKALYTKRQAIERTFKSLKQSRRLERHCVRGLARVQLHCLMAVLVYQATALASAQAGESRWLRWMVAKVA